MVAKGGDPAADKQGRVGTFEELAARYLEEHAKRHNKSWRQADALVRRHLLPRWGKLQAVSITRSDVKSMVARIEAPVVANQTLAAASAIFSGQFARNWRRQILASRLPATRPSRASACAWRFRNRAILVGVRRGRTNRRHGPEGDPVDRPAAGRSRAHAARAHCGWMVDHAGRSGAGVGLARHQERRQPSRVAAGAGANLASRAGYESTGPVFPRGGQLDRKMRAVTGKLPHTTPHDLRRTWGTTCTGLGLGREAMDRVMNHKDKRKAGVTDIYDRHDYSAKSSTSWKPSPATSWRWSRAARPRIRWSLFNRK